jgi:hypothetical protein
MNFFKVQKLNFLKFEKELHGAHPPNRRTLTFPPYYHYFNLFGVHFVHIFMNFKHISPSPFICSFFGRKQLDYYRKLLIKTSKQPRSSWNPQSSSAITSRWHISIGVAAPTSELAYHCWVEGSHQNYGS